MKIREPEEEGLSAGQQFVRRIGPFGSALFLTVFVLGTLLMFTIRPAGYKPSQTDAYYAAHPAELVEELNENYLPTLSYEASAALAGDGAVTITVPAEYVTRAQDDIGRVFDTEQWVFIGQ